jgi:hypothetical protein
MSDVRAVEAEPVNRSAVVPARAWSSLQTAAREAANPYVLTILGLWSAELLLLLILQAFGTGMGLRVRQTGEDRVWQYLMQTNTPFGLTKAFWAINDRNPLSPWWYLAARPLIGLSPYGIYLVRKLVDLFLAISVLMLVDRLGRGRHRLFAMSCAVLTLLWTFTGYTDQIMWNFLGALGVSLLMLWAYCKYVDSGRVAAVYLGISLVLYLVAIATYTLQCSTGIGVFAIGLLRIQVPARGLRASLARMRSAAVDTALYVSLFAVFTMFWYTAARPSSDYYALSLRLIRTQFWPSLVNFVWHFDYPMLLGDVVGSWTWFQIVVASMAGLAFFGALFTWLARKENRGQIAEPESAYGHSLSTTLVLTLAVAISIATATVALESMSAVWLPGWRSRMVQQVFQPLLYLGIAFAVLNWLRARAPRAVPMLEVVAPTALCTVALLVGLQFNRELNRFTAIEQRFEAGLKAVVAKPDHTKFIVRMAPPGVWRNSDSLSEMYVQTFYGSTLVNMRVLQPGPAVSQWLNYSTVIFGPADRGVLMGDAGASSPSWVPYSQVRVVSFDGQTVSLLPTITPQALAGYMVGFDGVDSIQQSLSGGVVSTEPAQTSADQCAFQADLRRGMNGSGWSVPEQSPDGSRTFLWMASTVATEDVDLPCDRELNVQFRVIYAMSPDILQSTALMVDGQPITLRSKLDTDGATLFEGTVPAETVRRAHGSHELRISVARTLVPDGGDRNLALALDRLDLAPTVAAAARRP